MANVTGREFAGAMGGGSTAGGQYIWLTLKLGDSDETIVVEKSRVTALMAAIGTAAGMARADRIKNNPDEEKAATKESAFALELSHASAGVSLDGSAILDIRVKTQPGQQMNLFLAADRVTLLQLAHACQRGVDLISSRNRGPKGSPGRAR